MAASSDFIQALYPNVNNGAHPDPFDPLDTLEVARLLRVNRNQSFQAEAVAGNTAFHLTDRLDLIDLNFRAGDLHRTDVAALADADTTVQSLDVYHEVRRYADWLLVGLVVVAGFGWWRAGRPG